MALTLRILMYKEVDDYSAVCLQPYMCVRGRDEAEVREHIVALFDSYAKSETLKGLGKAPDRYFVDWVETDGEPRPLEVEIPTWHKPVTTKIKEYTGPSG